LFGKSNGHRNIFYRFNSVTGEKQELTSFAPSSDTKFNWSLSPDGSILAMATWRRAQLPGEIRLLSLSSGKQRNVTLEGWSGISSVDWTADGRELWASASNPEGMQGLLRVDLRGRVTPMLQDRQLEVGWAIPSLDGRRVAIWEATGNSNVWALEGF
jgi:Tol biopolymer transport system component